MFRKNENVRGRYMKTYDNLQKEINGEPLDEGMTASIAKVLAMGLKRKVIGIGNQVDSATDLEQKINILSKQINMIAGLVLTTISLSDEKGLLSKGAILTSLFSSHEPDENLDTLFEDLC